MIDFVLFDQTMSTIGDRIRFLENEERLAVLQALRIIYVYPEEIIEELKILIDTEAAEPDLPIERKAEALEKFDQAEIDKQLEFLTSESVTTNLRLPTRSVKELRDIADYKGGIRGTLQDISTIWKFDRNGDKVLQLAKESLEDIAYLKNKIAVLEKSIKT